MTTKTKKIKAAKVPQGLDVDLVADMTKWIESQGLAVEVWGKVLRTTSPKDAGMTLGISVGLTTESGYRTIMLANFGESFRWLGE